MSRRLRRGRAPGPLATPGTWEGFCSKAGVAGHRKCSCTELLMSTGSRVAVTLPKVQTRRVSEATKVFTISQQMVELEY